MAVIHQQAIPDYDLLDEIGRGGMGIVRRARDLRLNREVAVKLLGDSYPADSPAAARFKAEARITGQLQHPGIPAVHELGMLPDGRPFLAMKLVRGRTLQTLLDDRSTPQQDLGRLIAVFEQICHAVGYAHAHGVIHRDLKPSNVMVGAFGEVQVMDWGLAKVIDTKPERESGDSPKDLAATAAYTLADTPASAGSVTQTGSMLGTPAYMPPEQAAGQIRKLNAQTDVFGLGAILCQILTGRPPYLSKDANDLRIQAVRGDMAAALEALDLCAAEPELVALCKSCLAFQREDRPADGQAVAEAVAKIRNQAEARARQAEQDRAAALAREAEQHKRRRQLFVAAAAIAAVLVAGIIGTTIGLIRADAAANAERTARLKEEEERKYAQAITAFVRDDFLALTSLEGQYRFAGLGRVEPDRNLTLKQMLDLAAEKLDRRTDLDPRTEAELRWIIGVNYRGQGEYDKAVQNLERCVALRQLSLGDDVKDTLNAKHSLAAAYSASGRSEEAIALYEQVRETRAREGGAEHPDTLRAITSLAGGYLAFGKLPEAIMLCEQVRDAQLQQLGAEHPDTLATLENLAMAYYGVGRQSDAGTLFKQVSDARSRHLGAEHPDTLRVLDLLAATYRASGQFAEAVTLCEQVRAGLVKKLGADHPQTMSMLNNLALAYLDSGKATDAIALLEQVRDGFVKRLGNDHPQTINTINNLALAYHLTGRLPEAVMLYEQVRDTQVGKQGADHPDTLTTFNNLAAAYQAVGRLTEALALFEQAATGIERKRFQHEYAWRITNVTITAYEQAGQLDKAEGWRRKLLAVVKAQAGAESQAYGNELSMLGMNLLQQKKWTDAETVVRECLGLREKAQPNAWNTFNAQSMLGGALLGQKKYADAEPLLVKGYEGVKARAKTIPPEGAKRIPEAIARLIQLYDETGKTGEAARWRREYSSWFTNQLELDKAWPLLWGWPRP